MSRKNRRVLVLGAGVTGLTAAWALSKDTQNNILVLEKQPQVGGLATTMRVGDLSLDLGSHRLHNGYDAAVAQALQELCGTDLVRRPRNGIIYIQNKPVRYPPTCFDIARAFGATRSVCFTLGLLRSRLGALLNSGEPDNFEDYTIQKLGRGLYEHFYKPYVEKLYGISPRQISKDPAVSRVRKFSPSTIWRDAKRRLRSEQPCYLYPRQGIGQICTELQKRFQQNGGRVEFIREIESVQLKDNRVAEMRFINKEGESKSWVSDVLVSTIPGNALLATLAKNQSFPNHTPFELQWRALRVLCLVTQQKKESENETLYFPERQFIFGRVSELHKYSPKLNKDVSGSVLTIEIPCSEGDRIWNMPDEQLAAQCLAELNTIGIVSGQTVLPDTVRFSVKLKNVYPVYDVGWKERFERFYSQLDVVENLYMIGRTALFLHCNIDHCMLMALALARHLSEGPGLKADWNRIRSAFTDYRVRE